MTPPEVNVKAASARDIQLALGRHERPYLTIEPLGMPDEWQRDMPAVFRNPARARPTVHFQVTWNGWSESFSRKVESVEELFEVLKPIFREHKNAWLALSGARAKEDKKIREQRAKELRESAKKARSTASALEKQADDLERG